MCAFVKAPPDSVLRIIYLSMGWLLIVLTPIIGALPGPGGIFVFAGGAALLLKNSNWVKRAYVRFARRHPKYARWADKGLRRSSAPRRRKKPETPIDFSPGPD
jgi:ribosomal protein L24E